MTESDYRQNLDDAVHYLELVRRRTRERKALIEHELPKVSGAATSHDGAVSITVNADGVLRSLTFSDRVRQLDPTALSQLVLSTYDHAQRKAAREAAELLRPTFGEEGHLVRRFQARRDAPLPPEAPSDHARPTRSPSHDDDDDDEFEFRDMRG